MEDKQETFDQWLKEEFLLDEIVRTPGENDKLEKLYNYLQLLKEYDEELGLE